MRGRKLCCWRYLEHDDGGAMREGAWRHLEKTTHHDVGLGLGEQGGVRLSGLHHLEHSASELRVALALNGVGADAVSEGV